ncbi:uncharacterized protein At4g19900 [Punica granatum]|uniref:Alpha 1,4-glycosyltransferase domain-containing protein n=2 Tax=Punica granatum TaxID=22663 RepID=A0A218Y1U6_PUNGR|nr:uncharacterized protein At4g19900 [Punica granatum]OWM91253.1 hypothetical protein CDL15_Pgr000197 [Punica granatum]PKI40122.1 hypothetical protein CRG98_039494 [Punica granatum]
MSIVDSSSKLVDPRNRHFSRCSLLRHAAGVKRGFLDALYRLPTSVLALLLLFFLAFNALSIFSVRVTLPPARIPPEPRRPSTVMYAVRTDDPPLVAKIHLPVLQKDQSLSLPGRNLSSYRPRRAKRRRLSLSLKSLPLRPQPRGQFSARVKGFFRNSTCKLRFFMTWISSPDSFGERDTFALESLFHSQPSACLVIVSSTMDSARGNRILTAFQEKGFKVMAVSPDFAYLFKNTHAQLWFNKLVKGTVDPGEVALGQNLSNLLRLSLLYKFGGVYIDTDVVILRSFVGLRNVIGAQTVHAGTGNWSRLNNAVLVFDKNHPLLFKFIEEFALTFNGNKWGHNGPYLVSRVVARVSGRPGFNFTVLPPSAFYPVDWSRVRNLFRGPRGQLHSKWLLNKFRHISRESYAVHLWNRQSRKIRIEEGSIVNRILSAHCVFCNKSISEL